MTVLNQVNCGGLERTYTSINALMNLKTMKRLKTEDDTSHINKFKNFGFVKIRKRTR